MSYKLQKTLTSWARDNATRKAHLQDALDTLIEEILAGKGSQMVTASTNGNSFSLAKNMSNDKFAACLQATIEHLDNDTTPSNVTTGGHSE